MSESTVNSNIPGHVAIIMDGNGRWANARAHSRVWGHVRGSRVVSKIVQEADDLGVKALTLYAFSTENWCRPQTEIKTLFVLLKKFLKMEKKRILDNKILFRVIGDTTALPLETKKLIQELESETASNSGLKLTFAFGYGGRKEILDAVNDFIEAHPGKKITEDILNNNFYAPDLGDVDLLIRTGGDQRISNFLLWQSAYAELFFTNTKWPDFKPYEFKAILEEVSGRERRFGAVSARTQLDQTRKEASQNLETLNGHAHV
tara:strand:+ start:2913 stop:3695 length:783 start_codon:yes stop_codon:yes gene_type:complete